MRDEQGDLAGSARDGLADGLLEPAHAAVALMHREHDDVGRVPGEEAEAGLDRIAVAPDHLAHVDAEAGDGAAGTAGGNQPPAFQRVANPREILPGHS